MIDQSDDNLVMAARRGDREAYAKLVRQYYKPILLVCLGYLGRRHDAEDAAQETMLQGFMKLPTLRKPGRFFAWLKRIAINNCINRFRNGRPTTELNEQMVASHPADDHQDLWEVISLLPNELRRVLVTYYFDGQDVESVARQLGISASTVYWRLQTAKRQLHRHMTET